MPKPLIALTSDISTTESDVRLYVNRSYASAIEEAGGIPLYVGRTKDPEDLKVIMEGVDGLLLTKGEDIHPRYYQDGVLVTKGKVDEERDALELALLEHAKGMHIPTLGVCRGMQIMNMSLGGTLFQDLGEERTGGPITHIDETKKDLTHDIAIEAKSQLATILGDTHFTVTSFHHQGIKRLGAGLVATARTSDALVEAIEYPAHPFFIGVEWHPEELAPKDAVWKKLFTAFVEAAKAHNATKGTPPPVAPPVTA